MLPGSKGVVPRTVAAARKGLFGGEHPATWPLPTVISGSS